MIYNMEEGKRGHLTSQQYRVLKLRIEGKSQEEIATEFGTSRQNISLIERRAQQNIEKAMETIRAYKELMKAAYLIVEPGTHLVDVPRLVVHASDEVDIKLRADFTRVYNELKFVVPDLIDRTKVVKPIKILIMKDGDISVSPA
jgi:hypothetical protein